MANPTVFDQRERAFEKKFAQDEERLFKAHARRNRLIGQWAAEKLGMSGTDAESYAKALVTIDMDKPGSDEVFSKLRADFDSRGVVQSSGEIRRLMDEFRARAMAEIDAGR